MHTLHTAGSGFKESENRAKIGIATSTEMTTKIRGRLLAEPSFIV